MAIISKKSISPTIKKNMYSKAGYREKDLLKKSDMVYTANNGRTISFLNRKTGRSAMWDKKTNRWVN